MAGLITLKKLGISFLALFSLTLAFVTHQENSSWAQPLIAKNTNPNPNVLAQVFSEKVFTVTKESDGIIPGTLRMALMQASGIRSQNTFTLVRIVFDPSVKRIRVSKGLLPEIDGSLTTLDCQTSSGRGVIEGFQGDNAGEDPTEEVAGLKITSNGNTVRNCHITGFGGPGILVRGNRNLIEFNTVGYHKDSPETVVDSIPGVEEPKTNKGAGIALDEGANDNLIQNNDIVANTYNGVLLTQRAGAGNKVVFNYFSKNSGKPIAVVSNNHATLRPQITKISRQGEFFIVSGLNDPQSEIELYMVGKDDNEIGMLVTQGATSLDHFTVATKNKGFTPNQTKVVAVAHGKGKNTSEFSSPILISATPSSVVTPETEIPAEKSRIENSEEPKKDSTPPTDEDKGGIEVIDADAAELNKALQKDVGIQSLNNAIPETTLNVKGLGDKGGTPDSGVPVKNHEVSSLGI